MFKIQRLEITGFKSFADHTEIVFNDNGITAVVGPNGCGKSNVAESIAWVLGEQRAKQLRGAEMKDVIFQGTRTRKPSGMAEVVLHLVRDASVHDAGSIEEIDAALTEFDENQTDFIAGADEDSFGEATPEAVDDGAQAEADGEQVSAAGELVDGSEGGEPAVGKAKGRGKRHWRASRLVLDFAPGETVSVARRLYRSGESEYLLNGRACRLRDIQDLFSGTGLSGAHYAIIEQGRIGQILSAKPTDRRALIEEAAGITKFRVRQRAAEARLEGARANLNRISDIVSEVERQVGSLRRQAAKARRYAQLRDELRELLGKVYQVEYRNLRELLANLRANLAEMTEAERRLNEELAQGEEAVRVATGEARVAEENLAEARSALAAAALQRDRREREYSYQQEQAVSLEERIARLAADAEAVRTRLAELAVEIERQRIAEAEVRQEVEAVAQTLAEAEATYTESLGEAAEVESQIENLRAELLKHTGVAERLLEIGRQLEATLDRLAMQAEGLEREGERARQAHQAAEAEAARLAAEIETEQGELDKLIAEREQAVGTLNEARKVSGEHAAEHARLRDEHERVRHRLSALAELDARRAHYSEAIQKLFSSNEDKGFAHRGTLADELRVAPQHERAVEAVLGNYLQAVIVPTPMDALRAAEWLRTSGHGSAHFLITGLHGATDASSDAFAVEDSTVDSSVSSSVGDNGETSSARKRRTRNDETNKTDAAKKSASSSANGKARSSTNGKPRATTNNGAAVAPALAANARDGELRLGDVLGAQNEILSVLNRTLAREMNALVANDLEQAMEAALAANQACVTTDGEFVIGGSLINAGSTDGAGSAAGLLAFKREMRELETSATELEAGVQNAETQLAEARARVAALERGVAELNERINFAEREQHTRELNHANLMQDTERAARHMRVVAADTERLADEMRELTERRETARREAETAQVARREAAEQVDEAARELARRRNRANEFGEQLSQQRALAATAAERRRAAAQELRRTEAEITNLEARLARDEAEIAQGRTRYDELQLSITGIEQFAAATVSEQTEIEQSVQVAAARLTETREAADRLATEFSELNRHTATVRDRRAALEVGQAEAQARLNYLREACLAELQQPLEELANAAQPTTQTEEAQSETTQPESTESELDLEAARAHVEELRARIENIGAVNMMALEELAEAEERLTFLTAQRQDIIDGIKSTDEALREIKRRSRERFRFAFEQINRNFSELFAELFGGGRGEMNLIDTEDILESGIDIIAQPPGKRLQNMLLLSGGEKAMTALALVVAIFKYRPSPFCLLDEVDAPLDEANVGRFVNKIVDMSAQTQFIVITHNKRTMEAARSLYGVTMEEQGVSKLVSAKFE